MTIRVLVVEDDEVFVRFIKTYLEEACETHNFQVSCTSSLTKAIFALANKDCVVDVCLLDLNLYGIRGTDSLHTIMNSRPNAPVVVVTGDQTEHLAQQCVAIGAQDFISKDEFTHANRDRIARTIDLAIIRFHADKKADAIFAGVEASVGALLSPSSHESKRADDTELGR